MLIRHCYQCAHSSRQSPLQGRNRVAHARAPRYECHQKMKAHALRHNKFFQPSESMRTSLTSINPPGGATSLRTRALQFANVTRQSMRGHRAASDAQPSESMRTFLASIDPPRAQPRCARARSNSRMSRDNQCAGIALHPMPNHPNQGAHSSRQSTLQGRNRVAHARAPIRECHATINARVSRCIRHNHPNQCAHPSRQSTLQGRNLVAHARAPIRECHATINARVSRCIRHNHQPRCARARSNSRMSRDNQCAYSSANHPSKGATALRMRALQFANVTRQSMRAPTSSLNRIRTTANRQGCASRIFRHCRSRAPQGSG